MVRLEPADLVEGCPELAPLVDVHVAHLLRVRPKESLTLLKGFDLAPEDLPFDADVGSTSEPELTGEIYFVVV